MTVAQLALFQLRVNRKKIAGWCVAIFSTMFLYMILFPSVQDMAKIKMEAMPEALLQLVGMEGWADMGNFVTYFNMIYALVLIAISIFAGTFAAGLISKEEQSKTIEFLYALPVSRAAVYLSKCVTASIAVIAVMLSSGVATILCGFINGGETFVLMDVLMVLKFSSAIPFIFLCIALLVSGVQTKVSGASVASFAVLLTYMLGYLSAILPEEFEWMAYFSPFEMISPAQVLIFDTTVMCFEFVYMLVMAACLIVGCLGYRKRDFNI